MTVLDMSDDVARVKLGGNWRMPTVEEWAALRSKCIWSRTIQNGVYGYKVSNPKTGNSIFLPAAGGRKGKRLNGTNYDGGYWSSSLCVGHSSLAWCFTFEDVVITTANLFDRTLGQSVRPVTE